jgi:hypothetical protein
MNCFYKYSQEKGKHIIDPSLLWDYDLKVFDWQKSRGEVVKRILMMGRLSDFFAAFDLYGGIEGVREIARDEVNELSDMDFDFMCKAFNLNKEETLCYRKRQSRHQLLNS